MPELPEVEIITTELKKKIRKKKIKTVEVRNAGTVQLPVKNFKNKVVGRKVKNVLRRAKVGIIELTGDIYLLIHLKMSGQLVYYGPKGTVRAVGGHPIEEDFEKLPNKFTRVIFIFSDSSKLFFNDVRKFGWIKVVDRAGVGEFERGFGVEPLNHNWTKERFDKILKKYPKRNIKQLLMDQKLIAGIGNIYADESCFCASNKPTIKVKTLKRQEINRLFSCIPKILKKSIAYGGTSARDYVRSDGRLGSFGAQLKVYGREKEKCNKCGGKIKKIRLNNRGTHYCPGCQK